MVFKTKSHHLPRPLVSLDQWQQKNGFIQHPDIYLCFEQSVECKCLQFLPTLQAPSKECIFSQSVLRIDHYDGRNIKTDIWYRYTSVKIKILVAKFKYSLSIISRHCSYFVSVASTLTPPPFNAINHDIQLLDHAVSRILKREEN